jgi:hypothetical protein
MPLSRADFAFNVALALAVDVAVAFAALTDVPEPVD